MLALGIVDFFFTLITCKIATLDQASLFTSNHTESTDIYAKN